MSTIAREWLALHAFPSLPFADTVMSGKVQARAPHSVWELPPPLLNAMNAAYNVSQVTALKAALEKQPITLIQGPPGTGKTRIILSLLSVILHAVPGAKSGHELELQRYLDVRNKKKPRTPAETSAMIRRAMPWLSGVANPRDAPPLPRGAPPPPKTPTEVPEIVGDVASKRTKVLVCAPSNSALDEIVLRIMQSGLFGPDGDPYSPTLVRVGVSWHHSVESVTMEALVNERQGAGKDANKDGGAAEKNFERALERDRAQIAILDEAAVVCSTLSFSGSGMFARMTRQFDVVVIDEAAQAVEPSTLVPLCYGAKQVFLVGDPRQLPATVLSSRATEYAYNQSLFKRFERCGYPIHVLKTQYRMHPAIREFPSARFYQNELEDGPRQAAKTSRPWHNVSLFRPFVFVDIAGKEYLGGGTSWSNDEEAHAAVAIATALMRNYPQLATGEKIGIISPYKAQVRNIRKILNDAIGEERSSRVDVNSIDGFQGREKEVCVFSVCRAPREDRGAKKKKTRRLGFVSDERRMNVGLTRARASLIVLGSGKALKASGDENWCALVNSARERDLIVKPPSASGRGDCTVADVKAFVAKITGKYDADDLSGSEDEIEIDDGDDALAYGGDVGLASGTTGASGGGGGGGGGGASTHVHRPAWERKIARRDDGDDVVVVGETKGAAAREGFSARGHVDELVTEAEGKLDDYGQGGGGGDDDVDPYAQEAEKPGKATKPRAAKRTRGAAKGAEKAEKVEKTPPVKRTRAR